MDCGGGRIPAAADCEPAPIPAARTGAAGIWMAGDGSYVNCLGCACRSVANGAIGSAATAKKISRAISIRAGRRIGARRDGEKLPCLGGGTGLVGGETVFRRHMFSKTRVFLNDVV